jgi:uncharacterized membrane protein YfcA
MDPVNILILGVAGLAGGFVAGLLGVGGGIIFAPVLLFFYQATGVPAELIVPMTAGSSLFCTLIAALSGTYSQLRLGTVRNRVVRIAGVFAAIGVTGTTLLVTTQPWYNQEVFGLVLAGLLLLAVVRMLRRRKKHGEPIVMRDGDERVPVPRLAAAGVAAGTVASAAGVGGGIVLVPVYNQLLRLELKEAAATSMATIVLISLSGVVVYMLSGLGAPTPGTAVGYVDYGHAVWLAGPAILTARLGVKVAARVNVRAIRWGFAALATIVAVRLILRAVT